MDEEAIEKEINKSSLEWTLDLISKTYPGIAVFLRNSIKILIKEMTWEKRRQIEGDPPTIDEIIQKLLDLSKSEFSEEDLTTFKNDKLGQELFERAWNLSHLVEEMDK